MVSDAHDIRNLQRYYLGVQSAVYCGLLRKTELYYSRRIIGIITVY